MLKPILQQISNSMFNSIVDEIIDFAILQEDGSFILQEDGSFILQEH